MINKIKQIHGKQQLFDENNNNYGITCVITTRGRYFSTLPLTIQSVLNQDLIPNELLIYNDEEIFDINELYNNSLYKHLFSMLNYYNITFKIVKGSGGTSKNHNNSIYESRYDYIWRIDDDEVAENNVLYGLINTLLSDCKIGAVGGLVLSNFPIQKEPVDIKYNLINKIFDNSNIQCFDIINYKKNIEVEHLHSTFLYRKDVAKEVGGYPFNLTPVSFREETIFSFKIYYYGYKLLVNPNLKIWHYWNSEGGCRSVSSKESYEYDEQIFLNFLKDCNVNINRQNELIYLDGDINIHIILMSILDEIIEKHKDKKIIISCKYREIFERYLEKVEIISIEQANKEYSKEYLKNLSINVDFDNYETEKIKQILKEKYLN